MVRVGTRGKIPKLKEPPEEAEDDYEEGQITEGPKKKTKIENKNVLVGDDSVHQTGDIIPPDTPVTASPTEQPSGTFISASDGSTLAMPGASAVQQPSRRKCRKKKKPTPKDRPIPTTLKSLLD